MTAHEVILASAGTGKTWQLSDRFLRRLASGVAPDRILATTFTRKAAAQILDRVLGRLVETVESEAAREALATGPGGTSLDRAGCLALLGGLVRRIDRFDVRTLDSFFVELARVFALELGLPAGWSIAAPLDDEGLRAEAVSRLLAEAPEHELIELLRELDRNQARRSVHGTLMEVVRVGHAAWLDAEPDAWRVVKPPAALPAAELAAAVRALKDFEIPRTKTTDKPRAHWTSNVANALAAIEGEEWDDLLDLTLVKKIVMGEPRFDHEDIGEEVIGLFEPLIRHAAHFVLEDVARRALNMRDLIARYDGAFRALQRERRSYRFEDIPRALLDTPWHGARGAFRRDGPIDHLLLDEFQDTSALQWRVLREQAEAILEDTSGERSLFCVGDVKQSIYGWRSGEPRLLAGMEGRYPQMKMTPLEESWRSGPVVLDTVNQVFGDLAANAVLASDEVLGRAARRWQQGFGAHTAHFDLPAAVRLMEVHAPAGRVSERKVQVVQAAARHVAALHREAPHATIGVLFRYTKHLPLMLRALHEQGVLASGEGGNALTDSAVVCAALSLLWLADHPADGPARYHVATSVLGHAVGLSASDGPPRARELAAEWRARLLRDGYGASLASLAGAVRDAPDAGGWEQGRFGQLVDLGYAWDARSNLRPSDFFEFVHGTPVEDPRAAPIKVISVHRAKGLDYDAVVLPDLDGKLINRPDPLLTERADPDAPYSAVCPSVGRGLQALDARLLEVSEEARARAVQEELCVLYVAMTRAKRRLDLLVASRTERDGSNAQSFATILRAALAPPAADGAEGDAAGAGAAPSDGLRVLWAHEDNATKWAPPAPDAADPSASPAKARVVLRPSRSVRSRRRRAPSASKDVAVVRAADLCTTEPKAGAARGSVFHEWLSRIEWLDDGTPREDALRCIAHEVSRRDELGVSATQVESWLGELRPILLGESVRELLTHGGSEQKPELWRERRFAVVLDEQGEQSLVQGAFDRVHLTYRDGAPVGAEVIDFKTGRVDPERYRPQMEVYRRALAALTGLPAEPGSIRCTLLFLDEDELREV